MRETVALIHVFSMKKRVLERDFFPVPPPNEEKIKTFGG
jgi:hypothetical protein